MAKSNASGLLTSLDSLFTTQEQRDAAKRAVVLDLPLDQIGDFPNHPFKVRQDDAMMEMMESVQLPCYLRCLGQSMHSSVNLSPLETNFLLVCQPASAWLPASFYTQTPFLMAEPFPAGGCCPP